MAVCYTTYRLLTDPDGPYAGDMIGVEPHTDIPLDKAVEMDCRRNSTRDPHETKGDA